MVSQHRWLRVVSAIALAFVIGAAISACTGGQDSAESDAAAIVKKREHIAAVQTMTALLEQQSAVEGRATSVAIGAQQTATAQVIDARETATAIAIDMVVKATQEPIIAAATIAAAEEAGKIKATAIIDAAKRAEQLAAQGTATAQALPAYEWKARYDAAALIVATCAEAREIADQTHTVGEARNMAGENQYYTNQPIGHCQ